MKYSKDHKIIEALIFGSTDPVNENDMIEKISKSKISVKYSPEIPDERCIWADNTKAKRLLDFNPGIEIQTGLTKTINQFYD